MIIEMMMMMNKEVLFVLTVLLLCWLTGCNDDDGAHSKTLVAKAVFTGITTETDSTFTINDLRYGQALFYEIDGHLRLEIAVENFSPNSIHAIHIHDGSCEQPGMHWNQNLPMTSKFCSEVNLGSLWAKPYAGDVGNLSVGDDGSGSLDLETDFWTIGTNDNLDLWGKTIIIHQWESDFIDECDPLHDHTHAHFNPKVACGSIELTL